MVDGKVVIAEHNVIALGKYLSHTLAVRLVYRYLQKWASRGVESNLGTAIRTGVF